MSLSISQLGMAAMLHDIVERACPQAKPVITQWFQNKPATAGVPPAT